MAWRVRRWLPSGPFVGVAVGGIILLLRAAARKPRRDGVVNREKILERAQELFATEGLKVSLHGIADDLGIGIDTVYRHFAAQADVAAATTTTTSGGTGSPCNTGGLGVPSRTCPS